MNKSDVIKAISKKFSSKIEAKRIVDSVFEEIAEAVKRGEKVSISGFGSFQTWMTKSKKGRNPKTGEELIIVPMKKVRFKLSENFFNSKKARKSK